MALNTWYYLTNGTSFKLITLKKSGVPAILNRNARGQKNLLYIHTSTMYVRAGFGQKSTERVAMKPRNIDSVGTWRGDDDFAEFAKSLAPDAGLNAVPIAPASNPLIVGHAPPHSDGSDFGDFGDLGPDPSPTAAPRPTAAPNPPTESAECKNARHQLVVAQEALTVALGAEVLACASGAVPACLIATAAAEVAEHQVQANQEAVDNACKGQGF